MLSLTWVASLWDRVRTSYWFVPTLPSLAAAGASVGMQRLDYAYADTVPVGAWWIYGGNADGARTVLGAVAGSMHARPGRRIRRAAGRLPREGPRPRQSRCLPGRAGLFVDVAFDQIRHNAASSPVVLIRLLETVNRVAESARTREQKDALRPHARAIPDVGQRELKEERDRAALQECYQRSLRLLEPTRPRANVIASSR